MGYFITWRLLQPGNIFKSKYSINIVFNTFKALGQRIAKCEISLKRKPINTQYFRYTPWKRFHLQRSALLKERWQVLANEKKNTSSVPETWMVTDHTSILCDVWETFWLPMTRRSGFWGFRSSCFRSIINRQHEPKWHGKYCKYQKKTTVFNWHIHTDHDLHTLQLCSDQESK